MAKTASPLVSVIIPAYKVEKTIGACIETVVGQTYTNLEIILVDDKSPDGAGNICDAWAKKDDRIQVIHKPVNEGLNMARATGFKQSTGSYVTFLDSDDLFHRDTVKLCMEAMVNSNAEAVIYGFAEFFDAKEKNTLKTTQASVGPFASATLDTKKQIVEYALLGTSGFANSLFMTAWGKMYARKLVQDVDWALANYRSYEDNFWTPQLLAKANRLVLLDVALYFYRRNEKYGVDGVNLGNRLVGNTFNDKPVGYLELIDLLYKFNVDLAKKYKVDLTDRLKDLRYHQMWWRLDSLVKAELVGEENNLQYLKELWIEHQRRDTAMQAELESLHGIKRSARLLAGNISRRFARQRWAR